MGRLASCNAILDSLAVLAGSLVYILLRLLRCVFSLEATELLLPRSRSVSS
jgi:hypothetical protein